MNKADLIAHVATASGVTKDIAATTLDTILADIEQAMKKGEDVLIYGFGTFSVTDRPARKGRNPQNGAEVDIPASKAPKFSASKLLKTAING